MRITPPQLLTATLLAAALAGAAAPAAAQFGRIGERVKKRVEQKVGTKVDKAVDNTVDKAEQAVTGDGAPSVAPAAGASAQAGAVGGAAEMGAFVNFDFVPGERVLFADDFMRDEVGNFPRRLQFGAGNMEVAEWRNERWLRGTSWPSVLSIPLPEALPERFTVEMEVVPGADNRAMRILFSENPKHHIEARYFQKRLAGSIRQGGSNVVEGRTDAEVASGTPFPLRIMADGKYVKVYVGGTRVVNMPNAEIGRSKQIRIELAASTSEPGYVRNLRVAAGGKKLYDALNESGRVATQGIYFDTGSDRIGPESAPTLKEITAMLKEHGDLKLTIEGHTDNVGNAASNQTLSEKRAAALVDHLVKQGIAASRLEAKGFGASKPAASNDTPEGRQQNRRVELVRR